MNNGEIIAEIAASIFGQEVIAEMLAEGKEIPLHTAKGWNDRGYRVKKGEHGIEARLWNKRKTAEQDDPQNQAYYKAKAYLFRSDQVERI